MALSSGDGIDGSEVLRGGLDWIGEMSPVLGRYPGLWKSSSIG
jgi:hypothetical protein